METNLMIIIILVIIIMILVLYIMKMLPSSLSSKISTMLPDHCSTCGLAMNAHVKESMDGDKLHKIDRSTRTH